MTIHLIPDETKRRFVQSDFAPLEEHYVARNFQVHVVQQYARKGLGQLNEALAYVVAYFSWDKAKFIRAYFSGRRELLELATSEESYRRIVTGLKHPIQEQLVSDRSEKNRLVLAGPGSGKTRVIVHRIAYLVRVLRATPASIIALTFNRAAAQEIKKRLVALVGKDAYGVTILTYHALALRLTGTSLAALAEVGEHIDFDAVLTQAMRLLEGGSRPDDEADDLRERLLMGYRYVLVDEYQDIDASQYRLVSALAGRTLKDRDRKLTLLAVGDDDQNIYAFRGTDVGFIRRFEQDYQAETAYLIENYRASRHIIAAANALIGPTPGRLKSAHAIRIDHQRRDHLPGGRWETLDPLAHGRVQILTVARDRNRETQGILQEIRRLKALDLHADWSDFAVLTRTRAALDPLCAYCEWQKIPYCLTESGQPELYQTREGQSLICLLRRRSAKTLRSGALSVWFRRRFPRRADDPWAETLRQCIVELEATWQGMALPVAEVLDAIFEVRGEARQALCGRITLTTVHGAKGREFNHVLIADDDSWQVDRTGEERRLYYVAMTRARKTLTLCQRQGGGHPFIAALSGNADLFHNEPGETPPWEPEIDRCYTYLGLADVDLGYAGRQTARHAVHRAIGGLQVGLPLSLVKNGGGWLLTDASGIGVGRLSRKFKLPEGRIDEIRVTAIVQRSRRQCQGTPWADRCQVEDWEVVLAVVKWTPPAAMTGQKGASGHTVP